MVDSIFARLDFSEGPVVGPHLFRDPVAIFTCDRLDRVIPTLQAVEKGVANGRYAVGFVSYEAAAAFESACVTHATDSVPLVWFALFDVAQQVSDVGSDPDTCSAIHSTFPKADEPSFTRRVEEIRQQILNGDVYQVNLTIPLDVTLCGDPLDLYHTLAARHPEPFSAYIDTGKTQVISLSPELFFRLQGDEVVTRPMKGTSARGRWSEEDDHMATALRLDEKQRAENLMIVDLLRNDLGRIAVNGSVRVTQLFEVERHPTLLQMTSTISAKRRKDVGIVNLFQALFPCGSITGAPKIAAMKSICKLESSPRGIYCGAIGVISPNGDCAFSVAIRTLVTHGERAVYGVGGGITWDSKPEDEWNEAMAKSQALEPMRRCFELIESIRLENGDFTLWDRHVARMRSSANYFQFRFNQLEMEEVAQRVREMHPKGVWKVRFLLGRGGYISGSVLPVLTIPLDPRVVVSRLPVDERDILLFHKTTCREIYNLRRVENPEAYDVLMINRKQEITEFTTGNVAVRIDGMWRTPPRGAGLLNGTLREELLTTGVLIESPITVDDLFYADEIWYLNSVRGIVKVKLLA